LISKYEVTNAQYAEFLNLKAAANPLALWDPSMYIARSGSPGCFTYSVPAAHQNQPVNYVSFYDSLRFTNWLSNGQGSADTPRPGRTRCSVGRRRPAMDPP
jgi:formylglycine-generating enzyme required for sulfatase activity